MNKNKMMDFGNGWQDLRKQAKQLESEMESKLVSFNKLSMSYKTPNDYGGPSFQTVAHRQPYSAVDVSGSASSNSLSHMSEAMAIEIEQLLASLTKVNDQMSEFAHSLDMTSQNATLLHTLQRHRDILLDYSNEFRNTRLNIVAVKEREELLGSIYRGNSSSYKNSTQTDIYLKEHQHLLSSERLVDEQISIAVSTKENLMNQRGTLQTISHKVVSLTNRFPVLNNLIMKINLRKKRDSIIIALLVSSCLIFIIWYLIH